jgi:Omp85 superfamily domain
MTFNRLRVSILALALVSLRVAALSAQQRDTIPRDTVKRDTTKRDTTQRDTTQRDTTFDLHTILGSREDRSALLLTSGKTYNRVEGLPIMIGPSFRGNFEGAALRLNILGIMRTAHAAHWDSGNLGHRIAGEARFGGRKGYAVGATSYDVVTPIERWQLPEPEEGLSSFFFKRDYLDWFGRHGAQVYASAFASDVANVEVGYANERWSSRAERDVASLFRGARGWRINPGVDDGTMHLFTTHLAVDSRNAVLNPWAGWFLDAQYEYGTGNLSSRGIGSPTANAPVPAPVSYGRAFFDVRKYNRISPRTQLNLRAVIGGWLHGDPLPLERRFSVGGVGTIPGYDFRRADIGTDVGQCSTPGTSLPGRPAMCERVALAQIEYRDELHSDVIDMFNRNGIRLRGAAFNVRPSVVAFVDAGRGWLVGSRQGKLQYPSSSLPPFDTYRTDVGLGLDLSVVGIYVAKAVSTPKEPANFFVRIRNRF